LKRELAAALLALAMAAAVDAQTSEAWLPRGVGGGGALFNPSFSPHDERMFVACDMGQLFRSPDLGRSWHTVDARQTRAFAQTVVRYTSDPQTLYALMWNAADQGAPGRSNDGGLTWQRSSLAAWPADRLAQKIYTDLSSTQRILVVNEEEIFISVDAGNSFRSVHRAPAGTPLFVAGAFFDGSAVYVGGESGLLRLDWSAPAARFAPLPMTGWPALAGMGELAAAREGDTVRFIAIAVQPTEDYGPLFLDNGDPYYYEQAAWHGYVGVYRLDLTGSAAAGTWVRRDGGFRAGELDSEGCPVAGARDDRPTHVAMAVDDIDVAYIGGYPAPCRDEDMRVYRTLDGAETWTSILTIGARQNVQTGWAGFGSGDRNQTYDAPLRSLAVHPYDANLVAYSGNAFVHVTENGTSTNPGAPDGEVLWRQAYTDPVVANVPRSPTPTRRYYRSAGLENTSVWDLAWSDAAGRELFAAFTDIRAIRSRDGGASWAFDFDFGANARNTAYRVTRHPSHPEGTLYAALSGVHDLYQSHRSRDAYANDISARNTGRIVRSTDHGATWQLVRDFGRQLVWFEIDPSNPQRAFASVLFHDPDPTDDVYVGIEEGGIYLTENLGAGMAATWQRLPTPPRTEGHPFVVKVLPDGGLVASYSVRRTATGIYTESSGVFYKPSIDTQQNWQDRSAPASSMRYWTKDVVVDPHDASGSTWFAAVYSSSARPGTGGIYRTTDRGLNWQRVLNGVSAESLTVDPDDPDVAYATTRDDGLWRTGDLRAPMPTFVRDEEYPFAHPTRVIFNPIDSSEVWALSFGNGLRVGRTSTDPLFRDGFE
jgi:hypothetical protein